jgi:hypothetical protein
MNLIAWVTRQPQVKAPDAQLKKPSILDHEESDESTGAASSCEDGGSEENVMAEAETLIFLDADGVVNVGIRDMPGQSPLLLCESNLDRCRQQSPCAGPSLIITSAAARCPGHGDEGNYAKFATTSGSSDISPIFAERAAEILRLAGPKAVLVLSSSWRKYQNRVEALEAALTKFSDRTITFDARTKSGGDEPEKRLQAIGEFVSEYSENRDPMAGPLRVVVLEDFAATHPKQWKYANGLRSIEGVEDFWRKSSSQPDQTFVKLIHTYDEWHLENGTQVQIGCGLTCAKVSEAERFLVGKK